MIEKNNRLTAKQWLAIVLVGLAAVVLGGTVSWYTTAPPPAAEFDAYQVLGVDRNADIKTIKKAYRDLSLHFHPDKHPNNPVAEATFLMVSKAYDIITDAGSQAQYEKYGNPDGKHSIGESIGLNYMKDLYSGRLMYSASEPSIVRDFNYQQFEVGFGPQCDEFESHGSNQVKLTSEEPVSTFSVDVDTVSYSYARRQLLKAGRLPPSQAVNVEEFINYFDYDYPQPNDKALPFETSVVVSDSPWNEGRKLMQIGIKGYDVDRTARPFSNLVFLVDVSGSMETPDKLPLAKEAMKMLLTTMQPEDFVSIVTYASNVNVPLPPTSVANNDEILHVLNSLRPGGGTWGTGGIEKAYELAEKNFDKDAVNRIMLVTDGDFNIGLTDTDSLQSYIEKKRETGIFLSVLGFGMGNYKDTTMKALANHGNGIAAYIDSLGEAQKVMVTEAFSTVFPIAKDVKLQIEFNPAMVHEYRLVGYEKRVLRREDFNNDKVDAGDIGSGHTVTAIYEFSPSGSSEEGHAPVDPLRYYEDNEEKEATDVKSGDGEYAFVKIRYKLPHETESKLLSRSVAVKDHAEVVVDEKLVDEFRFATAVASFAQILKGDHHQEMSYDRVIELAKAGIGEDTHGYRMEFIDLVRAAKDVSPLY